MKEDSIMQMAPEHVRQVAQLEHLCFPDPWPEAAIAGELTNPLSLWLVALRDNQVCGYIGSQSVMDEADVMNLAVHPDCRRFGLGTKLVLGLIERLRANQVRQLTLEVRASNDGAQRFYQALGFTQVGRRPNYYCQPREDALILRKEWEL